MFWITIGSSVIDTVTIQESGVLTLAEGRLIFPDRIIILVVGSGYSMWQERE